MASVPKPKLEKSSLFDSISPWSNSRSSTPRPTEATPSGIRIELNSQRGSDHTITHQPGLSSRRYPIDCPPLNARWFYAVDSPKRKPKLLKETPADSKPLPAPKKFVTFSPSDSRSVEQAYQRLIEEKEDGVQADAKNDLQSAAPGAAGNKENTSINEAGNLDGGGKVKVPVQEDFLFDVDVERRELAPVYWLGPIYEVRRGSWFFQEGSVLRPCEENLALQLEEGYLKVKPFRYPKQLENTYSTPPSSRFGEDPKSLAISANFSGTESDETTPRSSIDNLRVANKQAIDDAADASKSLPPPTPHQPQTHRLFGSHMNSIVTYQDDTVAWLSSDGIMSRVSSTVYQRFAGGAYLGGVKCVRGFKDSGTKSIDSKAGKFAAPTADPQERGDSPVLQANERQQRLLKRRSAPPSTASSMNLADFIMSDKGANTSQPETRESALEQQISFMVTNTLEVEAAEEAAGRRDEKGAKNDYQDHEGEVQSREIGVLLLCTHGVGQRLGMRTENVNFVHDVDVLRQNLKSVYASSADLQALNSEIDQLPKNCRIQVLPVCWRHLLDFPRQGLKQSHKEQDLGEDFGDDEGYPSLEDITVEGVPFVRSLITDLALDVLLYQSSYREQITRIVREECNRVFRLFIQRNPYFNGNIGLIGHSLGSAVLFDILCRQEEDVNIWGSSQHDKYPQRGPIKTRHTKDEKGLRFDFNVEDFYCLGSPIGLFQMLKGRTIAARHHEGAFPAESPMDPDYMADPFLAASSSTSYSAGERISSTTGLPFTISSPKCSQLYNIFHPSDPIAYRLEPLIAPAMSSLKPQALPYTKKGIFGASASQGLTGIGAKVGQSVSGFWSSLSGGIASSLLNRSLGLTGDDVANMNTTISRGPPMSVGAGTNISGGVIAEVPTLSRESTNEKKRQLAEDTAAADRDGSEANASTLIDDDIETLYAGFQKRRKSRQEDDGHTDSMDWAEAEERSKKLRREELKVRGLNQTGRVDFSIQEGMMDLNPLTIIASHLSYWADEDVAHFVMSQLLSRHRASSKRGQNTKGVRKV